MLHSSEIGSRFYHMQKTVVDDIMTAAQYRFGFELIRFRCVTENEL